MANNFTGRQIIVNITGLVGPACNFKIVSAWWQDIAAGGQTLTFTDAAGRSYSFTSSTPSSTGTGVPPLELGKLDWVEGPLNFTAVPSGNVYLILGYK